MKKLTIDKYIQGTLDESFTVPLAFVHLLNTLLPKSAFKPLIQSGIDLKKIITMSKQNEPYCAQTELKEKGITKKIIITLYL